MTEKRFELNNIVKKGTVSFWDNKKQVILNASHTLDKLNYFEEKNKQLEKENEQLKKDSTVLILANQDYRKENEQLKQSYKEFEDECQSTFNAMSRKQNDLYRKNFKLKEENEQLKCGNKNLKATLNDFINILNRLQSNPTDKQTLAVARDMIQNMGKELEE